MFISLKLKPFIAFVLIIASSFLLSYLLVSAVSRPAASEILDYVIVLDAGHGGRDGGAVGVKTKTKESDINLSIVRKLEKHLTSFGFKVVLTRKDSNGLYNVFSRDYKLEDMQKRRDIIKKANANILISIHMNAFPSSDASGAQTFYDIDSESSKLFAEVIQNELKRHLPNARKESKSADYYILKCTQNPSIMVECGYLSNPEEDLLLSSNDYQEKMSYYIFCGIVKYFQNI